MHITSLIWASREFDSLCLLWLRMTKASSWGNSTWQWKRFVAWLLKCLLRFHWPKQAGPSLTSKEIERHSFIPCPKRESQKFVMNSTKDLNSIINDIQGMICWRPNWSQLRQSVLLPTTYFSFFNWSVYWKKKHCYELRSPLWCVYVCVFHVVLFSKTILISNWREESDSQRVWPCLK